MLCAVLGGCATSSLEMAPERPDQPWTPETTVDGEIVPGTRAPPPSSDKDFALPANTAAAALQPPQPINASHTYTLPELIDIAERSNPSTKIAWNAARNMALAKGIAESTFLPRLTASAIGGYQTSHGGSSMTI